MPARRLVAAVLAAALVAAACSGPDRCSAADELGDRIQALQGIADICAQAGLEAARAAMADFEIFTWRIFVICGETLCDSARADPLAQMVASTSSPVSPSR